MPLKTSSLTASPFLSQTNLNFKNLIIMKFLSQSVDRIITLWQNESVENYLIS